MVLLALCNVIGKHHREIGQGPIPPQPDLVRMDAVLSGDLAIAFSPLIASNAILTLSAASF
jgi:hypothetical protein